MPPRYKLTALPGIPLSEVERRVSGGKTKPADVHFLGNFLSHFEEVLISGDVLKPEEIREYALHALGYEKVGGGAYQRMTGIRNAYRTFYEDGPFLRSISVGVAEIWREHRPRKLKSEWKQKCSRMAAPVSQLPQEWQDALKNMSLGIDGVGRGAPSAGFVTSIGQRARELTKVCDENGLRPEINVACVTAYERSMLTREVPLRPATIRSALAQILDMALYLGIEGEVIGHLRQRASYHERRAGRITPLKERKIVKIPPYSEVFEKAFDLLGKSRTTTKLQQAQQFRNFAAALVLMVPFPLRLADTKLHFGTHLTWTGETWRLHIAATSKTGDPFQATLQPFFRVFVDQLVLQGASEDYLEELRDNAVQNRRALFETHLGKPVAGTYVSQAWAFVYGTGSHIARTKLHNELAVLGLEGIEAALTACNHRSARTAEHYRTKAFRLLAGDHVRITAANGISDEEWKQYF